MESDHLLAEGEVGPTKSRPRPPKSGLWNLCEIVLTLAACVAVLAALLIPAVEAAREAARRSQCTCNLCGIKLALINYHDANGSFPPAYIADASGKPMHSWRVLILPWMERKALYDRYRFDEPWDGPNNRLLLDEVPTNFQCPSRPDPGSLTSYVLLTGPGTVFPGSQSTKQADITDGTASTIMIVETSTVAIPWTAPQDLDVRTMSFRVNDPKRPSISSHHPGGANIVFVDASTWFLKETITPGELRARITIAGGERLEPDPTER